MSGPPQNPFGFSALGGWVVATGIGVFSLVLAGLLGLSWAWISPVRGGWELGLLAFSFAVLLGLAAARLVAGIGRNSTSQAVSGPPKATALWRRPWMPWALIALALLMFVAVAFALLAVVHVVGVPNELSLPVLAIAGVVALLGSLALVAVSFSLVNMADKTQPLGLPQGSVRAVIALSLVVLFAILSVYLFGSLNGGQTQIATCLSDDQSKQAIASSLSSDPVFRQPAAACKDGLVNGRFDVLAGRPLNSAGIDFAKQLLVLIGTLVTSVAGFYFGSKSVSEARDAMAGLNVAPVVHGVEPPSLPLGSKNQSLDLLGTGLNGARQVQVSRGTDQINATDVTSNDNRVHAKFNVPDTAAIGGPPWDVTVTDGQGRTFRLPGAVTVVSPETPGKGAVMPQPDAATASSPAPSAAALTELRTKLQAQSDAIALLRSVGKGAVLPSPPDATLAELNKWLSTAELLLDGPTDTAAIATAVQSGTTLLGTVQNAGLPGALADILAVLRRVSIVGGPAVAGVPAGPIGIVLGVLSGLLSLAADQQRFDAAKAALLNTPFDPGTPPPTPTRDMAMVAVRGTAFSDASPDQALAIMQAALQQHDGQPLGADEVATTLLANPLTASLLQQFATPALRAQAIEELRGVALFRQAREQLSSMSKLDVPTAAGVPAGKVDFPALLDRLQTQRGDPQVAAAIEKLVAIGEALAKMPGDAKATINGVVAASLDVANGLVQARRQI